MEDLQTADLPPSRRPSADRSEPGSTGSGSVDSIGSAIAMVIVCAGAYWLVRTPATADRGAPAAWSSTTSTAPSSSRRAIPTLASAPPAGRRRSPPTTPAIVVVHVAGAVVSARGLRTRPRSSRVEAAIAAAGGPLAGCRPRRAEPRRAARRRQPYLRADGRRGGPARRSRPVDAPDRRDRHRARRRSSTSTWRRSLNSTTLPGVGPATATAIVTERERNGPFLERRRPRSGAGHRSGEDRGAARSGDDVSVRRDAARCQKSDSPTVIAATIIAAQQPTQMPAAQPGEMAPEVGPRGHRVAGARAVTPARRRAATSRPTRRWRAGTGPCRRTVHRPPADRARRTRRRSDRPLRSTRCRTAAATGTRSLRRSPGTISAANGPSVRIRLRYQRGPSMSGADVTPLAPGAVDDGIVPAGATASAVGARGRTNPQRSQRTT